MRTPLSFVLGLILTTAAFADPPPFNPEESEVYDKGSYGIYPENKFKTTSIVAPRLLRRKWDQRCETGDYWMFNPRGLLVGHPGPILVDSNGDTVWHSEAWPVSYGLTVQKYRGEKYLTFWAGNDQVIGHGQGDYFMLDKNYNVFKKISAIGDLKGDLHEFKITWQDTAILTSYIRLPWDLSPYGGPREGFIWECIFQEIDLEEEKLLFEWRATEHFTFENCYNPLRNAGAANNPWDWFHINSIEKDKRGNYLISSRYTHSLSYVNGKNGNIMWQLGGKRNNFKDLSDGNATNFAWQHDARWIEPLKTLSIFDNAAYFADQKTPARGLKLELDFSHWTAKVIAEAHHPQRYVSESQGSAQVLRNGNMFLGYGSASAFTEFTPEGQILCDLQFGALHYHNDGSFSPSAVMSYRAYKHAWEGHPTEPPKVAFGGGEFYVSWNGATELKSWQLEATNALGNRDKDWKTLAEFPRTGFESSAAVGYEQWKTFRLTAKDRFHKILGVWVVYSAGEVKTIPFSPHRYSSVTIFFFGAATAYAVIALFRRRVEIVHYISSRRRSSEHYLPLSNGYGSETPTLSEAELDQVKMLVSPKREN